jgi:hypothetical protein
MALLFAVVLPLAAWAAFAAATRAGRALAVGSFVLLQGSIVASGSRGALLAAFAGLLPLALVVPRRRLALAGAAVAILGVSLAITRIPQPAETNPVLNPNFGFEVPINDLDARFLVPLENEIGAPEDGRGATRGLLTTSGRSQAWTGALRQAAERPAAGYGFGTEEKVFVDRFYYFLADRVENSYLATALQLGVAGVAALLALLAAVAVAAARAVAAAEADRRLVALACAGVCAAAAVLAFTQSFLTSVGSPSTAPAWIAAFLVATLSVGRPDALRELE